MYNWIGIIIFIALIVSELKYVKDMKIHTEIKSFEKIAYLLGIIFVLAVVFIFGNNILNYLLGALAALTFIIGYLKNGLSSKGFVSNYRAATFLSYEKTDKVIIERNKKNVQVFYSGSGISFKLPFHLKDFEKIEKLLKEKMPREKVKVEYKN